MLLPSLVARQLRVTAFLAVACGAFIGGLPARAISINGEGPDSVTGIYDRFIVGTYPGTPIANPTFIGASLNLSAIGWDAAAPTRSITLVSPQYFLGASHFLPAAGSMLRFFGTDQSLYSATVDSYTTLTYTGSSGAQASDLTLGRLSFALSAAVTPMPIFYPGPTDVSNPASFNQYAGVTLLNYGFTARMGVNAIDGFTEYGFGGPKSNIGLVYSQGAGAGETLLESGDSGSPTLGFLNGSYGLIGTHSGVDTAHAISVDAFVGYTPYVNQINAILANDGQALTFAGVPEPTMIFLGLALLGMCGAQRTRRARADR